MTRKDIESLPEELSDHRERILRIYDASPLIGKIVYRRFMSNILNAALGEYMKKDFFVGIICSPDKTLAVAATSEDYCDLIEKMLDANPKGWPQFILNAMDIQRSRFQKGQEDMIRFLNANGIDIQKPDGFDQFQQLLYAIAIQNHNELIRRGSPFKECPTWAEFKKASNAWRPK